MAEPAVLWLLKLSNWLLTQVITDCLLLQDIVPLGSLPSMMQEHAVLDDILCCLQVRIAQLFV